MTYDTPVAKVSALCDDLRAFLMAEELVDKERIVIGFSDMDDTALTVLVQCHVVADTYPAEIEFRHRLLSEIAKQRTKHGVLFYPISTRRHPP